MIIIAFDVRRHFTGNQRTQGLHGSLYLPVCHVLQDDPWFMGDTLHVLLPSSSY